MRQTIDEQKEENPNQNGRNGTNVAQRKYKACLNSQNRDISKRIVVPGVKKNRSDGGVGLLFTMESSVCTHDILVITPFLLFTLLCASTREWKLHADSSFARKHGFVPLPEWLYDERKHDCRIEGMLMADFPKENEGGEATTKIPPIIGSKEEAFFWLVYLSREYISTSFRFVKCYLYHCREAAMNRNNRRNTATYVV